MAHELQIGNQYIISCYTRIAYFLIHRPKTVVVLDQRRGPVRWITHDGVSDRESVTDLKFSPDGRFLVSAGNDGYVKLWSNDTGNYEILQEWNMTDDHDVGHLDYQTAVLISISPCSKYVMVSMGNCALIRDVKNGKTVTSLMPPHFPSREKIVRIMFFLDGRGVFIWCKNRDHAVIKAWCPYSNDNEDHLITLWRGTNNMTGYKIYEFSYNNSMTAMYDMFTRVGVVFSIDMDCNCLTEKSDFLGNRSHQSYFTPDNKYIVYNTDNGPKLWSLAEDEFVDTSLEHNLDVLSFSPNNRQLHVQKKNQFNRTGTPYITSYFLK